MGLAIVTKPKNHPVSPDYVFDHLRVDPLSDDVRVFRQMLLAVTDWLAGPQGWLGRSLIEQTLQLTTYCWGEAIVLPRPPLIAVESVELLDSDGAATEVLPASYVVREGSDSLWRLWFKTDYSWPASLDLDAIRVTYRAGYGPDTHNVPAGLRQAIAMTVARLFENRGDGIMSNFQADPFITELFAPYRVWSPGQ